ncbi:hypothetical protein ABK040_005892 [Willaertia magna]
MQELRFFIKQFIYTITGGLYYEFNSYFAINLIHFTLYCFLFLLPLFFIFIFGFGNIFAEIIYSSFIFLLFFGIKAFNIYFHYFFDTHSKGIVKKHKRKNRLEEDNNNNNKTDNNTTITNNNENITTTITSQQQEKDEELNIIQIEQFPVESTSTSKIEEQLEEETNNNQQQQVNIDNEQGISVVEYQNNNNLVQEIRENNEETKEGENISETEIDNNNNNGTIEIGEIEIPQFDGPTDTADSVIPPPNDSSEMKTFLFEYVDEFGEILTYEMEVTAVEYDRLMKEKMGVKSETNNNNNNNTGSVSIPVTEINNNQNNNSTTIKDGEGEKPMDNKYKFVLFGEVYNLPFDRRTLENLLDREDYPLLELFIVPLFAFGVAWMGLRLTDLFDGYWASVVFMCISIAQSQFSLIKSPQPEANSPVHYSKITSFSRPFYVLFFGGIALIANALMRVPEPNVLIFGCLVHFDMVFIGAKALALYFIMCFPVIFLFGLLPHPLTFLLVFFEQIHMHIFGGAGVISLLGVVLQLTFSILSIGILIGVGYHSALNLWAPDYVYGIYSGVLVSLSYLLSRLPSNPSFYYVLLQDLFTLNFFTRKDLKNNKELLYNKKNREIELNVANVNPVKRLCIDILISIGILIIVTIPQLWDAFARGNPYLLYVLTSLNVAIGIFCYYIYPQFTKHFPFLIYKYPFFSTKNQPSFKFLGRFKWAWFEIVFYIIRWIELIFYIVIIISGISNTMSKLLLKCHYVVALVICSICGMKLLRYAFTDGRKLYKALFFSIIIFNVDAYEISEGLLVDFFVFTYIMDKVDELALKLNFICIYSTPPLCWGSALHIAMQPLIVPFSQLFLVQLLFSVLSTAPLYPLIGGALWFLGYSRGVKFWEKDYRTKRKDTSNQRLEQSLDGGVLDQHSTDNLNSIFYEHLVSALRNRLPDIIRRGKFGNVCPGDVFIIINDNLTGIVHIIEVGNGVISFQIRGLEFKGTICQEEEQRSILNLINREDSEDCECLEGCCCGFCFNMGGEKRFGVLSVANMITSRWQSWQVLNTDLKLRTYNLLENRVANLMSSNDERKMVVVLYIRSIIYYILQRDELDYWISDQSPFQSSFHKKVDMDPLFTRKFDSDFDKGVGGITFELFLENYGNFITYFLEQRKKERNKEYNETQIGLIQQLCFITSLTGRRAFIADNGMHSANSLDNFIKKLHQLFTGDYRITSSNDEWVFGDLSILDNCIKPSICMALRLYQARFAADDVEAPDVVFNLIRNDYKDLVITHETDPKWRESIIAIESDELFSLRKKSSDKGVEYFILMLEMRDIDFNVVKLNKEGVRALWAGQQHELVFLGVEESERGSIQNMVSVLRNICNSCMDQPIGYPVMVSSVTTSYF